MSNRASPVLLALLVSTGCFGPGNIDARDLSAQERAVEVFQPGEKPACEYDSLGVIEATSGSAMSMGTYESTIARLQRRAAALGASGVIVLDHSKNQMADQATAKAIRCKAKAGPST